MRRGDRLFEIIEIIRSSQNPISAARIATELGVVKRTVYRDVTTLIAQGVPIHGEAVLGAQWVQTRAEPELARAAEKLIAKIAAVSPEHAQMSFVAPPTSVAPVSSSPEVFGAGEMRRAIQSRSKVRIGYRDANGAITRRIIWPILLGYRDEGRIVAAWCELRAGFRYFRTERMTDAEVLEEKIPRRMDILRTEWRRAMDAERIGFESRG